jgi:hypothetical protein
VPVVPTASAGMAIWGAALPDQGSVFSNDQLQKVEKGGEAKTAEVPPPAHCREPRLANAPPLCKVISDCHPNEETAENK